MNQTHGFYGNFFLINFLRWELLKGQFDCFKDLEHMKKLLGKDDNDYWWLKLFDITTAEIAAELTFRFPGGEPREDVIKSGRTES